MAEQSVQKLIGDLDVSKVTVELKLSSDDFQLLLTALRAFKDNRNFAIHAPALSLVVPVRMMLARLEYLLDLETGGACLHPDQPPVQTGQGGPK